MCRQRVLPLTPPGMGQDRDRSQAEVRQELPAGARPEVMAQPPHSLQACPWTCSLPTKASLSHGVL